jgi:formate dehydrogenase iron-sulfur subunit
MCPYEVPKFSRSRGIVRKCDMCSQRLSEGEPPACVQACPNEAIRISVVMKGELRVNYRDEGAAFLPGAPDPAITVPSTRYITARAVPKRARSSAGESKVQPAHWPLIFMLVFTQMGAGGMVLVPLLSSASATGLRLMSLTATVGGIGASVLHLGQPAKAWRSFLGWRRSWLTREILCFGVFPMVSLIPWVAGVASVTGAVAVFCSVMIYHQTKRPFWGFRYVAPKFFGTAAILGTAAAWLIATICGEWDEWMPAALAVALTLKLSLETAFLQRASESSAAANGTSLLEQAAGRMMGLFGLITRARLLLGILAVSLSVVGTFWSAPTVTLTAITLGLCLLGELLERYLFFRAVVAPAMP